MKNTKGMVFKTQFGVVPNLEPEEVARLAQLLQGEVIVQPRKRTLWMNNVAYSGTLAELAEMIVSLQAASQPSTAGTNAVPKGWEALWFKRDLETGKILVRLPDRDKHHFTLSPEATLPSFLIGMFAILLKKLGFTQDNLNVMFGKTPEVLEEQPAMVDAPVAEMENEPGPNGSGDVEMHQEEGELIVNETAASGGSAPKPKKTGKGK